MSARLRLRRPGRGSRGQSLVEFALVFPIFVLVLFALIDVGRYVYLMNAFNQAAREGARYAAVEQWRFGCPASVSPADRFTCTQQVTRDRIVAAPATVNVTVICQTIGANQVRTSVLPASCAANDLLTVRVETPSSGSGQYKFFTPIISQILSPPPIVGQSEVVVQ